MLPGVDGLPLVRQFKAMVMRALGGDAAAARQTLGAMGTSDPLPWANVTSKPTTLAGYGVSSSDTLLLAAGSIVDFGGESPPSGWLECDGSSLLRASYPALFAAIGTLHGAADGTHFNIPNHRGKFKRGWAHGTANDPDRASRTASATGGATGDHVGTAQGFGIESHSHGVSVPLTGSGGTANAGGGNLNNSGAANNTSATGGNETRPINAAVMSIIKF